MVATPLDKVLIAAAWFTMSIRKQASAFPERHMDNLKQPAPLDYTILDQVIWFFSG
jgi:hypothetical protein